jgi:formamidopyrimidine-DNA glycosylase
MLGAAHCAARPMPELPEVETIAAGVHRRLHGDTILCASFSRYREPFKTPADEMAAALAHRRIRRVRRVGKHIVFDLEACAETGSGSKTRRSPAADPGGAKAPASLEWIVHLGMSGRLLVAHPEVPSPAHTHAVLHLASGRELRFVDPRRFGRLAVASGKFQGSGIEPLSISEADFIALFRGRRLSIKAALLNQSLLHGVGNIYADESLFRARIRPTRRAGRLTREHLQRLCAALRAVLQAAIRAGGSSVSDYVDADGSEGFFQMQHRVYGREGEPCRVCGTPIRRIVLGGRGTHFCPRCQK